MKRKAWAILLILLLALWGCGSSDKGEDSGKGSSTPPSTAEPAKSAKSETAASSDTIKYKIKDGNDNDFAKVKQMKAGRWTATLGDRKYSLEKSDKYKFALPDGTEYKARRDDDKLKLKNGEDTLLEMKFYDDKVKVIPAGGKTYEFKFKEDQRVKVTLDDREIGKVKYYSDSGKLKAKDADDKEVAVLKGYNKINPALAPLLVPDLSEELKVFLMLYFFMEG
jgi:major membrane immunogen (membrane-anchored lipoprotein)